jgi:hypothetical protein
MGTPLARLTGMRVLEARFHPRKRDGASTIIVGRVYCDGETTRVESSNGSSNAPITFQEAMVEKLRYLVRSCGLRPYDGLRKLRSDYWSFVELKLKQGGES